MSQSVRSTTVSYSTGLRRAYQVAAVMVALLPIPVALLHLLPAFPMQARFLLVYAPLVCLLTLAYLIYVRDSLARVMFSHLLDPLPPRPRHYHERRDARLRRLLVRVRRLMLALLPGLLLLGSMACVLRYLTRLNDSIAAAGVTLERRPDVGADVGFLPSAPVSAPGTEALRSGRGTQRTDADVSEASITAEADMLRRLDAETPYDIPYFAELSALYIGSFLGAMIALMLMGLREYAKEALGLSEREFVLARLEQE
jgi:hypothetical protein